jgi:hypothetical protein
LSFRHVDLSFRHAEIRKRHVGFPETTPKSPTPGTESFIRNTSTIRIAHAPILDRSAAPLPAPWAAMIGNSSDYGASR